MTTLPIHGLPYCCDPMQVMCKKAPYFRCASCFSLTRLEDLTPGGCVRASCGKPITRRFSKDPGLHPAILPSEDAVEAYLRRRG